jgi:TonB family protein
MLHIGWRPKLLGIAVAGVLSFSAAAQERSEAAAWASVRTSQSLDQLEDFLDLYPTGQFAQEAREKYSRVANTRLAPDVQYIDVKFPSDVIRYGRSIGPFRVTTLDIIVEPNGRAGGVRIAQSSGFDAYDNAALAAARDATYLPALDRGRRVERRMNYDVSFGFLCNRATGNTTCDYRTYPTTCTATVCALLLR